MMDALQTIGWRSAAMALALGYLFGTVPFGLVFSWMAGAGDVRKIGSGNIGATNVLRTGKRWAAAGTLLCDGGKGAVAVLMTRYFQGSDAALFAAMGAFLGHIFPVWLGFRGGKGMATFLGVTLALDWRVGLLALVTWLVAALVWRMSSLSALIAAALVPLYMALFGEPLYAIVQLILALLVFAMHRENIRLILSGNEPRIALRSARPG